MSALYMLDLRTAANTRLLTTPDIKRETEYLVSAVIQQVVVTIARKPPSFGSSVY